MINQEDVKISDNKADFNQSNTLFYCKKSWSQLNSRVPANKRIGNHKVKWATKLVHIKVFHGQPTVQRLQLLRNRALRTDKTPGKSILKETKKIIHNLTNLGGALKVDSSNSTTSSRKFSPTLNNKWKKDSMMSREEEIYQEMYFSCTNLANSYDPISSKSQLSKKFPPSKYDHSYDFVIDFPHF